jgi:hypothetical protein
MHGLAHAVSARICIYRQIESTGSRIGTLPLDCSEILDCVLATDNHLPFEIKPGSDPAGKGAFK